RTHLTACQHSVPHLVAYYFVFHYSLHPPLLHSFPTRRSSDLPVPTQAARYLGAQTVIGVSVGMHDGHRGAPTNIFQVVSRAVGAAQKHQLELWERHADLVLRPDVQFLAWDDFARADEAIEAGSAAALRALPRIEELLKQKADAEIPSEARRVLQKRSQAWLSEVQA